MQKEHFWTSCGSTETVIASELVEKGRSLGPGEGRKRAKQQSLVISCILSPLVGDLVGDSFISLGPHKPICLAISI